MIDIGTERATFPRVALYLVVLDETVLAAFNDVEEVTVKGDWRARERRS